MKKLTTWLFILLAIAMVVLCVELFAKSAEKQVLREQVKALLVEQVANGFEADKLESERDKARADMALVYAELQAVRGKLAEMEAKAKAADYCDKCKCDPCKCTKADACSREGCASGACAKQGAASGCSSGNCSRGSSRRGLFGRRG